MTQPTEEKKIIIDEDWKSQVEREKAAYAAAQKEDGQASGSSQAEQTSQQRPPEEARMPPASFSMLITTLASEAMIGLGQVPHPATGKLELQLEQAKYFIDTLQILEEKTKGNLANEEGQMLEAMLHQLRMAYIEAKR